MVVMEYTFERKQVGRRNLWVREWRGGNSADVVRYDFVSYDTCIGMYFPADKILYIGLQLLPGKQLESRCKACFELDKDYMNEWKGLA